MGGAASAPGRSRDLPRGPGACRFSHGRDRVYFGDLWSAGGSLLVGDGWRIRKKMDRTHADTGFPKIAVRLISTTTT